MIRDIYSEDMVATEYTELHKIELYFLVKNKNNKKIGKII